MKDASEKQIADLAKRIADMRLNLERQAERKTGKPMVEKGGPAAYRLGFANIVKDIFDLHVMDLTMAEAKQLAPQVKPLVIAAYDSQIN